AAYFRGLNFYAWSALLAPCSGTGQGDARSVIRAVLQRSIAWSCHRVNFLAWLDFRLRFLFMPQSVKEVHELRRWTVQRHLRESEASQRIRSPESSHRQQQIEIASPGVGDGRLHQLLKIRVTQFTELMTLFSELHPMVRDRNTVDEHVQDSHLPRV